MEFSNKELFLMGISCFQKIIMNETRREPLLSMQLQNQDTKIASICSSFHYIVTRKSNSNFNFFFCFFFLETWAMDHGATTSDSKGWFLMAKMPRRLLNEYHLMSQTAVNIFKQPGAPLTMGKKDREKRSSLTTLVYVFRMLIVGRNEEFCSVLSLYEILQNINTNDD